MRFKHVAAIFGSALVAAAFGTPGAYERLLYYYAYKLDNMAGGKTIAGGCPGPDGVCTFDQFVHFIEGRDPREAPVMITPEEFPQIEPTVKLLVKAGKTGKIVESRIISNANDYPELLKKLGNNLSGILQKTPGLRNETLTGQELENTLQQVRANIVLSMKRVLDGRVRSTFDNFKPYDKFKVVMNGAKAIDLDETVAQNEGSITREKLQELWDQHLNGRAATEKIVARFKPLADYTPTIKENADGQIDLKETYETAVAENPWMKASWFTRQYKHSVKGNHLENIKALNTALQSIEPLVCSRPEARKREVARLDRRQSVDACIPWASPELKEIIDLDPVMERSQGVMDAEPLDAETLVPGEEAATGLFVERANRANEVSASEFEQAIMTRLSKVPDSWVQKGIKTFNEARLRIGYQLLESTSPELIPGSGGSVSDALKKVGGMIGNAVWVKGVVESFVTDTTALDKAAALSAIIPVIGCAVSTAAGVDKGEDVDLVTIDALLCGIGDVLVFGPLAPFGYALRFLRSVIKFFQRPPKPPTLEEMREQRDRSWAAALSKVYAYVYSHNYTDPRQSFAAKLESAFAIDTVSVLSEAARRIGALNASGSPDLSDPRASGEGAKIDPVQLETATGEAIPMVRQAAGDVLAHRQRKFLLDVVKGFANGTTLLSELAKTTNDVYIEHIKSEKFIQNYPDQSTLEKVADAVGDSGTPSLKSKDAYSRARAQMDEVGAHLKESPPPLPRPLNVAFILGQSKGIKFAQNETLDLFSYFNTEIAEASNATIPGLYRFLTLVRHTRQTALFLQGRLKEEELDDSIFPVDNLDLLQGLRLLAAMKIGKIYEEKKIERLDSIYGQSRWIPNPTALLDIVNPFIPPVDALHPQNNIFLLSLVVGLIDAVSNKDFTADVEKYLEEKSEEIRLQNWKAMQKTFKTIQTVVTRTFQGPGSE